MYVSDCKSTKDMDGNKQYCTKEIVSEANTNPWKEEPECQIGR